MVDRERESLKLGDRKRLVFAFLEYVRSILHEELSDQPPNASTIEEFTLYHLP